VIVASLDAPISDWNPGSPVRRHDFTSFFKDADGDILEYALNSRFFERV
jgi:hypothetical protein